MTTAIIAASTAILVVAVANEWTTSAWADALLTVGVVALLLDTAFLLLYGAAGVVEARSNRVLDARRRPAARIPDTADPTQSADVPTAPSGPTALASPTPPPRPIAARQPDTLGTDRSRTGSRRWRWLVPLLGGVVLLAVLRRRRA